MKFLPVLVLFAAAAGARAQETAQPQQAQVQQQPEFNGTWRLDADRSRLDDVKTPKVSLLKIEQHDPKVKFTITAGERKKEVTDTFELTPDGTVEKITLAGQPATARAVYEDGRLVLTLIRETPDGPLTEVRRAKVGDKGRMMTTIVSVEGKDGAKTGYGFYWKETDDGQRASSSR